jgi:hypothetical protein
MVAADKSWEVVYATIHLRWAPFAISHAGKTHITLDEYLVFMDSQTMHEDPKSVLESSFTIFDA